VAWWLLLSYAPLFGTAAGDASLRLIGRFPFWAVGPLLGLAYAAYWHAREARGDFPSVRRHAQVSGHPHLFDPKRVRWGKYTYDEPRRSVAVKFGEQEAGTLTVDTLAGDHMALRGTLNGDTVALSLTRVKPMKSYRRYWSW
jgi:hypothetical protein